MFKKYSEYLLMLVLSILLTLPVYWFLNKPTSQGLEETSQLHIENVVRRWNDLFYKTRSEQNPSPDVVVLAIDEASLIEIGRWPWSRQIIHEISEKLLKYDVKTLSYDIIFSEQESQSTDTLLAKTIESHNNKIILGTFSDSKVFVKGYQDYCLTQAFLYNGGGDLAKINPFFTVIDESNVHEELTFNLLFTPIFNAMSKQAEMSYFKKYDIKQVAQLSKYQNNTLNYFKQKQTFDYCSRWLTENDEYSYQKNPELYQTYLDLFSVKNTVELENSIFNFKYFNTLMPIPQYTMWRQNIKKIQTVAQYTASFVAHPDPDGIIRNYPLVFRTGNQLGTSFIPAMALQAYLASTGYQVQFKIESKDRQKFVSMVGIYDTSRGSEKPIFEIPVDTQGKMLLNYYGKQNTISYISAKDLLNDSPNIDYFTRTNYDSEQIISQRQTVKKADFFKDKNIVFGATAIGIYDIRTTPNDINYPGPEIHATALSNLLSRNFLKFDPDEKTQAPALFFIFILLNLYIFFTLPVRTGTLYFFATAFILIYFQSYQFEKGLVYKSALFWLASHLISYFIAFVYRYFFQSRKSNEIKKAFSKYVSKDLVEQILKNSDAIELRGKKLHMSVFFSDIRGFTEFSEKMDPVELSEMLNKYFTPMSAIITEHKGTIDKYIGDAVMAMFGAPVNYDNHAYQACAAALKCIQGLEKINEDFSKKNWPRIDIGIGINSGYMNAGNIGSDTIQNYTVIGDSVNLASRLESLNKEYGTKILISEFTYELIKSQFICRPIDKVQVKGKSQPVLIYELIGHS
jgi:adenylate cyclase